MNLVLAIFILLIILILFLIYIKEKNIKMNSEQNPLATALNTGCEIIRSTAEAFPDSVTSTVELERAELPICSMMVADRREEAENRNDRPLDLSLPKSTCVFCSQLYSEQCKPVKLSCVCKIEGCLGCITTRFPGGKLSSVWNTQPNTEQGAPQCHICKEAFHYIYNYDLLLAQTSAAPIRCMICMSPYIAGGTRTPIILRCGHGLCIGCAGSIGKIDLTVIFRKAITNETLEVNSFCPFCRCPLHIMGKNDSVLDLMRIRKQLCSSKCHMVTQVNNRYTNGVPVVVRDARIINQAVPLVQEACVLNRAIINPPGTSTTTTTTTTTTSTPVVEQVTATLENKLGYFSIALKTLLNMLTNFAKILHAQRFDCYTEFKAHCDTFLGLVNQFELPAMNLSCAMNLPANTNPNVSRHAPSVAHRLKMVTIIISHLTLIKTVIKKQHIRKSVYNQPMIEQIDHIIDYTGSLTV